ncbi:MAG: RNA-guided endonuclease InsQ/TnpB family protein [archaeon]
MKLTKSYTCKIEGNSGKMDFIQYSLDNLFQVSEYVFSLGSNLWNDQKELYRLCRSKFPNIHSKILQQFLKLYKDIGKKKKPKKPIKPIVILDNQTFNIQFDKNKKFTNYWLRFNKKNFALRGKRILERIKDISKIKEVRIFKRNNKIYSKLSYVDVVDDIKISQNDTKLGIDINTKNLCISNNEFYSTKKFLHKKIEYRKKKQRKKIEKYSSDFIHKLTSKIVSDLISSGAKVLILEDLKNLRRSSSRKNGTSKGKNMNYLLNSCFPYSMFQTFLKYKCLDSGILVEKIPPKNTSKRCSSCGSLDTVRATQSHFRCNICGIQLHADLNAARNIENGYMSTQWANSDSSPLPG